MSRLLADIRRVELERMQASELAAALEATAEKMPRTPRSAAADPARLRGLPMIGGVGGAIPGTRPGSGAHLSKMGRRRP